MDFELSEELTLLTRSARDFARKEVTPHAAEWAQAGAFPRAILERLGALGLMGLMAPEAQDGVPPAGALHCLPQPPQLLGSVWVCVQSSPQTVPFSHVSHSASTQTSSPIPAPSPSRPKTPSLRQT